MIRVISRNERTLHVGGRHYFACRCPASPSWSVTEMDQEAVTGSRDIGFVAIVERTRDIAGVVMAHAGSAR